MRAVQFLAEVRRRQRRRASDQDHNFLGTDAHAASSRARPALVFRASAVALRGIMAPSQVDDSALSTTRSGQCARYDGVILTPLGRDADISSQEGARSSAASHSLECRQRFRDVLRRLDKNGLHADRAGAFDVRTRVIKKKDALQFRADCGRDRFEGCPLRLSQADLGRNEDLAKASQGVGIVQWTRMLGALDSSS